MGGGSHKSVELSAEAAVEPKEPWQQAQAKLYQQLGQQLKTLWSAKTNGDGGNGKPETHGRPLLPGAQRSVPASREERPGPVQPQERREVVQREAVGTRGTGDFRPWLPPSLMGLR